MKNNTARTARGFTLIEVLIALVVLATGLLALAKFQGTLMQDNALAKQRTEATMYAQQKIEMLRSYSRMSSYNGMTSGSDTVSGTTSSFTRAWTITPHAVATAPQYTTVAVTMSWTDNSGSNQSYTLSTNIAANDPVNTGQLIATTTVPPTTTTSSSSTSTSSTSTTASSSSTTSTTSTSSSTTTTTTTTTTTATCTTMVTGNTKQSGTVIAIANNSIFTCSTGTTYSCSVTAPSGTSISLSEMKSNGNGQGVFTATTTANCGTRNVNF